MQIPVNLTIKSIDLSDLPAFMVATEKGNFVRVFGLEGEKLCKCLQAVVATINKVSLRKYNTV